MSRPTRETIIEAARRTAQQLGVDTMTCAEFIRHSGITRHQVYSLFPEGGWTTVLQLAGLQIRPQDTPLKDDDLLAEFHRVVLEHKRIPTWRLFRHHARVSADAVRRRFGGLQGTLKQYRKWLEANDPKSDLLYLLQSRSAHEIPAPPEVGNQVDLAAQQCPKAGTSEYGPPLNFRGLRHAPINEKGVIYLFGMVGYELGFLVEAIHSEFPDCEAKRCVDAKRGRWQRVHIEFEYQSRNFQEHGHDPSKCDLIVCWEHDWAKCPIEVLELRRAIGKLQE